jgi:hypothetical protein
MPGWGTTTSVWRLIDQDPRGYATLTDGAVLLDAIQVENKTWTIISGSRCH